MKKVILCVSWGPIFWPFLGATGAFLAVVALSLFKASLCRGSLFKAVMAHKEIASLIKEAAPITKLISEFLALRIGKNGREIFKCFQGLRGGHFP